MAMSPFRQRQMLRWQEAERRRVAENPKPSSILSKFAVSWTRVVGLLTTLAVSILVFLTVISVFQGAISVEPLSVPKSLSEAGFTADVAALQLGDAIANVAKQANSGENLPEIASGTDLPDIVVPGVAISVQTLAVQVAKFLGIRNHQRITGELIVRSGQVSASLRLDGKLFLSAEKDFSEEQLAGLLAEAARASLKVTRPYDFAVLAYRERRYDLVESVADSIIAMDAQCASYLWPTTRRTAAACHRVVVAHNLKGQMLDNLGRPDEAVDEYHKSLQLDPDFPWGHVDLGLALADLNRWADASSEFRKAIASDPNHVPAHIELGHALSQLEQWEDASSEYKRAIELKPKDVRAHVELGNALRRLGQPGQAIIEYEKAIVLAPKRASVHADLGSVLADIGQQNQALAEFKSRQCA